MTPERLAWIKTLNERGKHRPWGKNAQTVIRELLEEIEGARTGVDAADPASRDPQSP